MQDTGPIDIYDSEVIKIEGVLDRVQEQCSGPILVDSVDRMITEEFAKIGFVVDVTWWDTDQPGLFMPEITITGRTEEHEFDHERMAHEVQSDLLDLGEGGKISGELPRHLRKYL